MEEITVKPSAASAIESYRDFGYNLESAICDIIDNSITANAGVIRVDLHGGNGSKPFITITDNGNGMSDQELCNNMIPGCKNPLAERENNDLGRFGLGMKTASFSQCRKLTVFSKSKGIGVAYRWDLDRVAETDEWTLQKLNDQEIMRLPNIDTVKDQGTVVLWENMDRLVDSTSGDETIDYVRQRMDDAADHVQMVFHRFLTGDIHDMRCKIYWNREELKGFDPFHQKHPATQAHQEERIIVNNHTIKVQAFILPHHTKMKPDEWTRYGTAQGYLKSQGFYVYRHGRLIISNTWFNIIKMSQLSQLARVRVDIPSTLDHLWKIDVKKNGAQPPHKVKKHLKNIIDQILKPTKRVYTRRGHTRTASKNSFWKRHIEQGVISYRIDREHPVINEILAHLEFDQQLSIDSILSGIEKTNPIEAIFADYADKPTALTQPTMKDSETKHILECIYKAQKREGLPVADIIKGLSENQFYKQNPVAGQKFLDQLKKDT